MWPFLAARCRGLVPLGSVASPGLGSSSAAHMLLFRSSWTTWLSKHRRSRAARAAQPPPPLPALPSSSSRRSPRISGTVGPHCHPSQGLPCAPPRGCSSTPGTSLSPCPLLIFLSGVPALHGLTPTRPNSHARSRGVFPELSMMQGLDWCCRSISDCGGARPPAQ